MKGLSLRQSVSLGNGMRLNIGAKKTSITQTKGNVTMNSNGGVSIRLGKGLTYRFNTKTK